MVLKGIIPDKHFYMMVDKVIFICLLKCQRMDDTYLELLDKSFFYSRQSQLDNLKPVLMNTPNFHREEELVIQTYNTGISPCFLECAVGEKMNKECKEPCEFKFSVDYAFIELVKVRYILKQHRRNNYSPEMVLQNEIN